MALASGPALRALAGSGRFGLGGCGVPKRKAYEWGVRSTRKPEPRPLERVYEIPGLEPITYEGKMHFVPGLARPIFPPWDRGWKDPRYHRSAPIPEQPLYKEQPCYIFHQRCRLLEGMKQALWLTKTKLIEGLPKSVLSLVDDPGNHIENQEKRVLDIISHARLWHSPEDIPKRETYCPVIVNSLIQLCKSQILKHPSLASRMSAQNYALATTWNRVDARVSDGSASPGVESDGVVEQGHQLWNTWDLGCLSDQITPSPLFAYELLARSQPGRESLLLQVRGSSGAILSAKDPLPIIASREEVEATKSHVLETFYPISPTIDLQECHVYNVEDDTGFREDYPYPHAHTLYFLENANLRPQRFLPEQLRAKMLLFAFGNALARARLLYGNTTKVLEQPIVVQSVGTDGRVFQFLVLQLNTTDLASSEGIKNLVWIDSDQLLYRHFWCLPVIKKKVVVEPVGPVDFQPETFRKFLALYLHGAV